MNLLITVATSVQIGARLGVCGGLGKHAFTWGLGYAYLQAIHDVPRGAWIHE